MSFPMTTIGGIELSRMLCGTNPFFGYSHTTRARDAWLVRYFTVERIAEVLAACMEEGVNGTMSPPLPKMREALDLAEKSTGKKMHWIITPAEEENRTMMDQVQVAKDMGASFCMPHTSWVDSRLEIAKQRIDGLEPILERIRELGMGTGLSTHRPEAITVSDAAGYDIDSYIQPHNTAGFLCPIETDWTAKVINETPKPVMCIKPLAAARVMPDVGLRFVYSTNKPTDTVVIGLMSPEEAKEDIALARSIIEATEDYSPDLQVTRSKKTLVTA